MASSRSINRKLLRFQTPSGAMSDGQDADGLRNALFDAQTKIFALEVSVVAR